MTETEIAEKLQVPPRTIRRLRMERLIPAMKVGKFWRYEPDAVAAALKQPTTATKPATKRRASIGRI
jgi:excisionase family DNA binding protein